MILWAIDEVLYESFINEWIDEKVAARKKPIGVISKLTLATGRNESYKGFILIFLGISAVLAGFGYLL